MEDNAILRPEIDPTEISYDINIGGRYGQMDTNSQPLMAKFEQTDDYNPEDDYEQYARTTLVDRRPDAPTFAHEEPRRSLASKGFLNLIHTGNRGGSEPSHSEVFLEDTWGDPRGVATDPDFKKLREQHEARMKFVRWHSDADNSIASGRPDNAEMMRKQQEVFKQIRPRMRIFSTSKDGRREGIRRTFTHESDVRKVDRTVQAYGDLIKDYALNPQRKTTILSNTIIARTKMYQQNTTDHEFAVAKYGQDTRRRKLTNDMQTMKYSEQDGEFATEDKTATYKAMGLVMSRIVKNKHEAKQDAELGKSDDTQTRKTEQVTRDLRVVLNAIKQDAEMGKSDNTMLVKTAAPQERAHGARVLDHDASVPAHHLLNAHVIYKTVAEGKDLRKAKDLLVTDDRKAEMRGEDSVTRKAGVLHTATGKREAKVEVDGQSLSTHNYKSAKRVIESKKTMQNPEVFGSQSCKTQDRKTLTVNYKTTDKEVAKQDIRFDDNKHMERHGGVMGSKYTMRDVDRDSGLADRVADF